MRRSSPDADKREEEHECEAYQDHRPSAAEHFWHAVTLWFHALVVYDTCTHTSRRYPCNARQRVEKQRNVSHAGELR